MSVAKKYITHQQLRARWGDRSEMFVPRLLESDPTFPRPIKMGKKGRIQLFDLELIEEYEKKSITKR